MKKSIVYILTALIPIIAGLYFLNKAGSVYDSSLFNEINYCEELSKPTFIDEIINIDSSEIVKQFPYQKIIKNSNFCDVNYIIRNCKLLDSMYKNRAEITIPIMYTLLADSLISKFKNEHENYNPDLLINQIQWANNMKTCEKAFPEYDLIFLIVHDGWMNQISNLLSKYFENNEDIKYQLKFKILRNYCQINNYTIPVGLKSSEKLVDYLIESKYSYIWGRIYHGTGFLFKFIIISIGLINLFCVFYSIKNIFKK